jgi:hypothetical protein
MATRRKLLFNFLAILFAAMAGGFVHYEVNQLSNTFIDIRVAEVKVFAKLVRDNWDGIKSVSDEKKQTLLQTLDPSQAGSEIRLMRTAIIVLFYGLVGSIILDRAVAMFKLWKGSRETNRAP